jgi:hypothetical protein
MRKNSGILVSYIDKDGNLQKAIIRHVDQHPALTERNKVLVRLLNDDLSLKAIDTLVVKNKDSLTHIGFCD